MCVSLSILHNEAGKAEEIYVLYSPCGNDDRADMSNEREAGTAAGREAASSHM